MISYQTIDNKVYKVTTTKVLIDVQVLKDELKALKAQKAPSEEELLDLGRSMHPYYMDRDMRITDLEKQIKEIE